MREDRDALRIPRFGLGCTNFGDPVDEDRSVEVIKRAVELGVTFYDTADAYGDGRSETYLGRALRYVPRDEYVVATKFGSKVGGDQPADGGARPEYLRTALDRSCKRLGLDHIDLYQLHEPDPSTPIEDTLGALEELRQEGRIGAYGASNLSAGALIGSLGALRFGTVQTMFNVLHQSHSNEVVDAAAENGVGVIPWFPLAGGLLTGKYRSRTRFPADTRFGRMPERIGFLADEASFDRLDRLAAIAAGAGLTLIEAALGWLIARPDVTSVIPGAMSVRQLEANVRARDTTIQQDTFAALTLAGAEGGDSPDADALGL